MFRNRKFGCGKGTLAAASIVCVVLLMACSGEGEATSVALSSAAYSASNDDICNATQFSISPNGKYLQSSLSSTKINSSAIGDPKFYVTNLQCLMAEGTNCTNAIEDINSIRFLGWTQDEGFLTTNSLGQLIATDTDTTKSKRTSFSYKPVATIRPNDAYVLHGIALGNSPVIQAVASTTSLLEKIRKKFAGYVIIQASVDKEADLTVLSNRKTLATKLTYGSNYTTSLTLPFSYLTRPLLKSYDTSTIQDYGFELYDDGMFKDGNYFEYQFPYSNKLESIPRETIVKLIMAYAAGGRAFPYSSGKAQTSINWVAVNGDQNVIDFEYANGFRQILINSGRQQRRIECKQISSVEASDLMIEKIYFGPSERTVSAIKVSSKSRNKPKGVVLYYVGGPAGDILPLRRHKLAQIYLKLGLDVVFVGYSGTRGTGLNNAIDLRSRGFGALESDAAAVKDGIARMYRSTVPIIIHGESMGAAAGLALNGILGSRQGGYIGVVPFLKPKDPKYTVAAGAISGTNSQFQQQWESASLGFTDQDARNKFHGRVLSSVERSSTGRPITLIYGNQDRLVAESDLNLSSNISIRKIVVDGDHDTALLSSKVSTIIYQSVIGYSNHE